MKVKIYNSDGTRATCPHGTSVSYPRGTLVRVEVCSHICANCPCFKGNDMVEVDCLYPDTFVRVIA